MFMEMQVSGAHATYLLQAYQQCSPLNQFQEIVCELSIIMLFALP
jgi:hypothetical protein